MSLYFPKAKLVFVHIPKTAGSSFKNWCNDHAISHENDRCHSTWHMAKQLWPDATQAVTFVRNPFDRMVSMFMYIGQRAMLRQQRRARGKGKIKKNTTAEHDQQLVEIYQRGFQSWIQDLSTGQSMAYSITGTWHDRTSDQSSWIQGCDRCHVIRTEELTSGFAWLQQQLGCAEPLPQDNRTTHDHYRSYYDADTRDIVQRMFRRDLEMFGYEF